MRVFPKSFGSGFLLGLANCDAGKYFGGTLWMEVFVLLLV
jgi:hypothetical protein